jgi:hypothetical protein
MAYIHVIIVSEFRGRESSAGRGRSRTTRNDDEIAKNFRNRRIAAGDSQIAPTRETVGTADAVKLK